MGKEPYTKALVKNVVGLVMLPLCLLAQEEESAEVFVEEYTDEFQEAFFEGLKQKGIQNYDRAVTHFLECKRLEGSNSVVDYELAKTYYLDNEYTKAEQHAIIALNARPENHWYLEILANIQERQGKPIDNLEGSIPFSNKQLRQNLATLYYKKGNYEGALRVLEEMGSSGFGKNLKRKINDSLQAIHERRPAITVQSEGTKGEESPLEAYRAKIGALLTRMDFKTMGQVAKEALDSYPLQPYFHFAHGKALSRSSMQKEGIVILEEALEYVFDDWTLKNKIYKELVWAYTSIGQEGKANEYMEKIESGP